MATINRAPWNALVDDSGQNLDGSIWNKAAIKTVLLDPIDAALATQAPIQLTRENGTRALTAAGAAVLYYMPPLVYTDTIRVLVHHYQGGAAGSTLTLSATGDVAILRLDDIGGGVMTAGNSGLWDIVIRCLNGNPRFWNVKGNGGVVTATGGNKFGTVSPTVAHWLNGGWYLGLEMGTQSAGASAQWGWVVTKE